MMSSVLPMVVSNVLFAAALALIAIVVTRYWRSPQLAHALWALVLVKLITPPVAVYSIPDDWLDGFAGQVEPAAVVSPNDAVSLAETPRLTIAPSDLPDVGGNLTDVGADAESVQGERTAESITPPVTPVVEVSEASPSAAPWTPVLTGLRSNGAMIVLSIWSLGSLCYTFVSLRRTCQFKRVLDASAEAPSEVMSAAARLAEKLGLQRCPPVRAVDATIPPLVWSIGVRPIVLLPSGLLDGLDESQRDAVIAHELAHVRRRDDLVRWLEVVALLVFWWNPLAWFARRKLREAEEECCDAWVVWTLPHERRSYGEAMLKTIEFLTDRPVMPAFAGNTFGSTFYKRRIEMIMKQNVSRRMSWTACVLVAAIAVCMLPAAAQTGGESDVEDGTETSHTEVPETAAGRIAENMSLPDARRVEREARDNLKNVTQARIKGYATDLQVEAQQLEVDNASGRVRVLERYAQVISDHAQRNAAKEDRESPKQVLKERIDLLREIESLQGNAYKAGQRELGDLIETKLELLDAQLAAAEASEDRAKLIAEATDFATQLEAMAQAKFETDAGTKVDVLKAKEFPLQIRARAKWWAAQKSGQNEESGTAENIPEAYGKAVEAYAARLQVQREEPPAKHGLPTLNVSPYAEERKLQELLLQFDIEAAQVAADHATEEWRRKEGLARRSPKQVAQSERDKLLADMRNARIALERAQTVMALFKLKEERWLKVQERGKESRRSGRQRSNDEPHAEESRLSEPPAKESPLGDNSSRAKDDNSHLAGQSTSSSGVPLLRDFPVVGRLFGGNKNPER